MHAEMWRDRLPRRAALRSRRVDELWPYALGAARRRAARRSSRARVELGRSVEPVERGERTPTSSRELWEEMTEVRRSAPAGAQW